MKAIKAFTKAIKAFTFYLLFPVGFICVIINLVDAIRNPDSVIWILIWIFGIITIPIGWFTRKSLKY